MNPNYKPSLLATAVMVAFSAPTAYAQVADSEPVDQASALHLDDSQSLPMELSSTVVTAAGTEVDLRDAPASISVVTREDIERKPMASIAEVLGTLPGVTGGYSATGAGSKISFRGMPDRYTLILVDGKRVGSSQLLGHRPDTIPQDLDWLSPESIERIEVVRGAMSSLYGSEAMGGVINIITRKVSPEWGGSITSNYSRPQPSDAGDTSQIGVNVSGPLTDSLGLRLGGSFADRESDSGATGSTGALSKNVNAKLNWQASEDHSFSIDASAGEERARSFDDVEAREAAGETNETFGSSKMVSRGFGIGHEGRFGEVGTKLDLYVNTFENKADPAQSGNAGAKSKEAVADFKFDVPFELGFSQWLTAGLQYKEEEVENPGNIGNIAAFIPPGQTEALSAEKKPEGWAWAVFAENQVFLRDDLTLTLGLRTDRTDGFSAHTSPRAYLVYHPADAWTIKGGVSKGFRAPNLKERSLSSGTSSMGMGCTSLAPLGYMGGQCFMVGNPDLEPEISTNYELGVAFDDNDYRFEATYFTSKIKDMMQNGFLGQVNGIWYTQQYNIEEAKTSGVELSFGVPVVNAVSFSGNATYMIESENTTTGEALLMTPKWTANALLEWQVDNQLSTYLSAQYLGKQLYRPSATGADSFAEANTTVDLGGNYAVNKNLTLRAGIQNVFNDVVKTDDDYGDGDPRTFYVGFTSRF
ncbi:TonB-dependent receptor domain-containing protein [Pseudomonas sp. PDM11]|uniref:TonB-dependent receptor domain-containing protein n=1 Tax=Pseudomonas sp. PDM11 TaxID=2769309 RepID=UPI001785C255|nr:TonB-dependent receptor [Pseudomonas sp. PDM11]MBD9397263.1 TonB-dependent receptor [Pseudomonas sp. PDM11]